MNYISMLYEMLGVGILKRKKSNRISYTDLEVPMVCKY